MNKTYNFNNVKGVQVNPGAEVKFLELNVPKFKAFKKAVVFEEWETTLHVEFTEKMDFTHSSAMDEDLRVAGQVLHYKTCYIYECDFSGRARKFLFNPISRDIASLKVEVLNWYLKEAEKEKALFLKRAAFLD